MKRLKISKNQGNYWPHTRTFDDVVLVRSNFEIHISLFNFYQSRLSDKCLPMLKKRERYTRLTYWGGV